MGEALGWSRENFPVVADVVDELDHETTITMGVLAAPTITQ
jgi:hypothetical protein